jgi:hypothetical protein
MALGAATGAKEAAGVIGVTQRAMAPKHKRLNEREPVRLKWEWSVMKVFQCKQRLHTNCRVPESQSLALRHLPTFLS